jgi:HSP20 family protein
MFLTRTNLPVAGDLPAVANRLSRLLDETFRTWPGFAQEDNGSIVSAWLPPVDVYETREAVMIIAEVPGIRAEDVKISLENNVLTIRGEKRQEKRDENERVHRYERSYGLFERSFTLPATVDSDRITASYDGGVLTISLPKVERARPREITVTLRK